MLNVSGLSKSYGGKVALDHVSFTLAQSEVMAVVGDNGAGKSTLLSVLAAETVPDTGDVLLFGKSIFKHKRHSASKVAYVPQGIALNMNLTTMDTLRFWAAVSKLDAPARKAAYARLITLLGLQPFLKTKIKCLSVGVARRVNIAAALFSSPALLLMDEPTAGLDHTSRTALIEFIAKLPADGTSVIFVTHIRDDLEMLNLGDKLKILRLHEGRQKP